MVIISLSGVVTESKQWICLCDSLSDCCFFVSAPLTFSRGVYLWVLTRSYGKHPISVLHFGCVWKKCQILSAEWHFIRSEVVLWCITITNITNVDISQSGISSFKLLEGWVSVLAVNQGYHWLMMNFNIDGCWKWYLLYVIVLCCPKLCEC